MHDLRMVKKKKQTTADSTVRKHKREESYLQFEHGAKLFVMNLKLTKLG